MRFGAMFFLLLTVSAGCSDALETGYEPRHLGATDAARRGYYAQPFSAEATAAGAEKPEDTYHPAKPNGMLGAQ